MEGPKNSDTYGPYIAEWKYFDPCPQSENNIANISTLVEPIGDIYQGSVNITLHDNVRLSAMKFIIHNVKNNHKKLLWDYTLDKPCSNRVIAAALKKHIDIRSCVLRKGTHVIKVNFTEKVYMFFGSSFFYGEYILKFILVSRKKDILCVVTDEIISKKP
ncbi:uncharacterized protein LOC135117965 [Helicoverpa armigera]|uniref:uncharacterized protein LOC135117965 n=1 Tax=Helicoverpa armigera TaxID=29058 RepID=UPI00308386E5